MAEKKKLLYSAETHFYLPLQTFREKPRWIFGEADFYEGNMRHTGHYLNVSFPHSNVGYLQLFKGKTCSAWRKA